MSASTSFIFEIGLEELPARVLQPISHHIKERLEALFQANELSYSSFVTAYTPRRLFFAVRGLSEGSQDTEREIKGPPASIGFQNAAFTQATKGFLAKHSLSLEEAEQNGSIYIKDAYVYLRILQKGLSTKTLLEQNLGSIINSTPGERFMRSGCGQLKFSRPIRWLMALLVSDTRQVLDIELEGLRAQALSYGHRFLSGAGFEVFSETQYREELANRGVVLEAEDRKSLIISKSQELAKSLSAEVEIHPELLDEIANLVENPAPILCEFDAEFLKIPQQVLITVMAKHQRYFPLLKQGTLIPYFIAISNNPRPEALANIKAGNEKVIIPRFKDAEFFVGEDSKLSLEARLSKLEGLRFQAGNMLSKAYRIQKISEYIIQELAPTYDANPTRREPESLEDSKQVANILKAALLSKADLTSTLVFEFTELQGEIGGIYAQREGLATDIAQAISEHYKPRFAGDELPNNIGAKIISIADKLDTLCCFFAAGKIPKGSADPFALRRQANGLLEIILHSHLILDIEKLIDHCIGLASPEAPKLKWEEASSTLKDFLLQRLAFVFEIYHKETQINKAILAGDKVLANLNSKHMMTHMLYEAAKDPAYPTLIEAATRILNISKNIKNNQAPLIKDFVNEEEKALYNCFVELDACMSRTAPYESMPSSALFNITEPTKEFFAKVLVKDPDPKLKANREALLSYASSLLRKICDFGNLG